MFFRDVSSNGSTITPINLLFLYIDVATNDLNLLSPTGREAFVADCNHETLNVECVDDSIGKKHALNKYNQFTLNTSCFYPICTISRNFFVLRK